MTAPAKPDLAALVRDALEQIEERRRSGEPGEPWDTLRELAAGTFEPKLGQLDRLALIASLSSQLHTALSQQPAVPGPLKSEPPNLTPGDWLRATEARPGLTPHLAQVLRAFAALPTVIDRQIAKADKPER